MVAAAPDPDGTLYRHRKPAQRFWLADCADASLICGREHGLLLAKSHLTPRLFGGMLGKVAALPAPTG